MLDILIADDHELVRRGVRDVLQAQDGWCVCGEAHTGREAVGLAASLHPGVVILDMSMPDLNGIDATREVRRSSPCTEVVLFTMHHSEELAREAFGAGALGYVLKTDGACELLEAVRAAERHARFVSPHLAPARAPSPCRPGLPGLLAHSARLTPREREIVRLLAEGRTNGSVAQALGLSLKTVENHRFNVMQKLEVSSVVELVRWAVRNGLVSV
jgi:DNA-binding NarL/FixJ family response regulator